MKKLLIVALILLFAATSVFAANTISWLGEKDSGRVGLGVSKDGIGFIAFESQDGAIIYMFVDDYYLENYGVAHGICVSHSTTYYTAHTPNTEQGYFNMDGTGTPLIGPTDNWYFGIPYGHDND